MASKFCISSSRLFSFVCDTCCTGRYTATTTCRICGHVPPPLIVHNHSENLSKFFSPPPPPRSFCTRVGPVGVVYVAATRTATCRRGTSRATRGWASTPRKTWPRGKVSPMTTRQARLLVPSSSTLDAIEVSCSTQEKVVFFFDEWSLFIASVGSCLSPPDLRDTEVLEALHVFETFIGCERCVPLSCVVKPLSTCCCCLYVRSCLGGCVSESREWCLPLCCEASLHRACCCCFCVSCCTLSGHRKHRVACPPNLPRAPGTRPHPLVFFSASVARHFFFSCLSFSFFLFAVFAVFHERKSPVQVHVRGQ